MQHRTIVNDRTGERVTFLAYGVDDRGAYLDLEAFLPPGVEGPPEHVHPMQSEEFEVVEGRLALRIEGEERRLGPGETLTLASGVAHTWWADGDRPVRGRARLRPPMGFEPFLTTYFSLVNQGKVNADGRPGLLQTAAWLSTYPDDNRTTDLPGPVFTLLTRVLGPIARRLGYSGTVEYVAPPDPETVPGHEFWVESGPAEGEDAAAVHEAA